MDKQITTLPETEEEKAHREYADECERREMELVAEQERRDGGDDEYDHDYF